ncbi:MAG: hypothetical protein KC613_20610 [Myxococcales bacterium]|nr:hypothetical protein [Myxococcales bacterium]MCB9525780.1 hypothetical protein [Myxococcales bacterium]
MRPVIFSAATWSILMLLALPALAQDDQPEAPDADLAPAATVLHAPRHHAVAGEALTVRARIGKDWSLGEVRLRYRSNDGPWASAPFTRSGNTFEAVVPGHAVRTGQLAYTIESGEGATARAHFASIEHPHIIAVASTAELDRELVRLARYHGKRGRILARGEVFAYGARLVDEGGDFPGDPRNDGQTDRYSDRYWRTEVEYTYRTLGEFLHDFRFGIGLMRADWPTVDGESQYAGDSPGINYGFGEVNLEFTDWLVVGGRILLGASAEGFVGGVGAVGRLGNPGGTHFAAQVDFIGDIGTRTDLRLHWDTVPRVPMALGIELTNWPSDGRSADAANLSFDLGYAFEGGLTLMGRVGSAKRSASLDGGFQLGMTAAYEF